MNLDLIFQIRKYCALGPSNFPYHNKHKLLHITTVFESKQEKVLSACTSTGNVDKTFDIKNIQEHRFLLHF